MKLQRLRDGQLYCFSDSSLARAGHAIGGPFASCAAAYAWITERAEAKLDDMQRAIWADCLELAGGASADAAHLMAIIGIIARNRPRSFVMRSSLPLRYIPGRSPNYGT